MWLINNIFPICTLPKRETPTEPSIKIGPELFVNEINRSASDLEQILLLYKLQTTFAPTGYPTYNPHNNSYNTFTRNIENWFHKSVK